MASSVMACTRRPTPLYKACMGGQAREVRRLVSGGADVNAVVFGGDTALIAAATYCRAEIVDILLAAEADIEAADDDGGTALYFASCKGEACEVRRRTVLAAQAPRRKISGARSWITTEPRRSC